MSKIEVGEYVRTKEGYLGILIAINKQDYNYLVVDTSIEVRKDGYPSTYLYLKKENIKKYSKQLIDLIEVKDVIKYRIDNISTTLETKGYVEGIVDISDEEMLQRIKNDNNYHILEILTEESYMANCYKV